MTADARLRLMKPAEPRVIEPGTHLYRVYSGGGPYGGVNWARGIETVTVVKETAKMLVVNEWSFMNEISRHQYRKDDTTWEFYENFEEARARLLALATAAIPELKRRLWDAEQRVADLRREYDDAVADYRHLERTIPESETSLREIETMSPPDPPEKRRPKPRRPRAFAPLPPFKR
jgi:hypothetical protein